MRRLLLPLSVLLAVSCSKPAPPPGHGYAHAPRQAAGSTLPATPRIQAAGGFAGLADHGDLLGYPAQPLVRHEGASNWYRADISEAHALRAIVTGKMTITAPDGAPIHLRYQRYIEHPNGNWTWIGRDARGEDAIITFGEKAVFGSIPREGRDELRLSTLGGHSWIVEIIPGKQHYPRASKPDYLVPPQLAAALTATSQTEPAVQSAGVTAAAATTTVDVALGYTTGLASELGGDSQAVTRLQNLVDITNQAYVNSQIDVQIRLVRTVSVTYADATSNNDTLNKLTGSTGSSSIPVDPAFNGLRAARDQYGADLVALVRRFRTPENDGCGVAWLIGGGQTRIDNSDVRRSDTAWSATTWTGAMSTRVTARPMSAVRKRWPMSSATTWGRRTTSRMAAVAALTLIPTVTARRSRPASTRSWPTACPTAARRRSATLRIRMWWMPRRVAPPGSPMLLTMPAA